MKKSKQITLTINLEILEKMDNFARSNGISRSALITTAVLEYMQQKEGVSRAIEKFLQDFIDKNSK